LSFSYLPSANIVGYINRHTVLKGNVQKDYFIII